MKLERIHIENFRSIGNLTIETDPSLQILVGINEVGKSNILEAVHNLDKQKKCSDTDIRIATNDENYVTDAFILAEFSLEDSEIERIIEKIRQDNQLDSYFSEFLKKDNQKITLREYLKIRQNYKVQLSTNEKGFIDTDIFSDCTLGGVWAENSKNILIDTAKQIANDELKEIQTTAFPEIILWKYDYENLLPENIDLNSFIQTPDHCKPLKSMFELAGIIEIGEEIKRARDRNQSTFDSLLDRVSKKTTEYLRNVWKEAEFIEFYVRHNGSNLVIGIKDKHNRYAFKQRSEGFKRFIAFLLMLSAKVSTKEIENAIILIDEPDSGLHISGQKYLLQELIKMSENNFILFSTHSIFMIDKKMPKRHFIVTKEQEETCVKPVKISSYTDDEVIYNALGYSIFEALKENIIIFEGWDDKELFKKALEKHEHEEIFIEDEIGVLKSLGPMHAGGVSKIIDRAEILDSMDRRYVIISDSDKAGEDSKKEYEKGNCKGKWIQCNDIGKNVYTLEDFMINESFMPHIEKLERDNEWEKFNEKEFLKLEMKKLEFIKGWIYRNESDTKKAKRIIEKLKEDLINSLKPEQIESDYDELLKLIINEFQ